MLVLTAHILKGRGSILSGSEINYQKMEEVMGESVRNLLLENVEYKITKTDWGTWRRFMYPNGVLFEEFVCAGPAWHRRACLGHAGGIQCSKRIFQSITEC